MEAFISAIQKQVNKEVILYADRKIAVMNQILTTTFNI